MPWKWDKLNEKRTLSEREWIYVSTRLDDEVEEEEE
jgi:hypothetical protein